MLEKFQILTWEQVMVADKFSHSLSDWILNPMQFIDNFWDL